MKGSGRDKSFLIYAYEDPDNKIAYVGLTVDLKNRHSKHKCGCVRHGVRKLDVLGKYFQTIGKPLPNPIIKIEDLYSPEDAKYFENWYRELYEINGWTVLNIAKTGIGKSSIGGSHRKWTEKTIKDEIKKLGCVSRWELGVKNESAYQAAHDLGIIEELFPEKMIKENGYWMILENHLKEADGCKSKKDYDRKNHCAYNMAVEYGFIDKIFPENLHRPITDEELKDVHKYKDRNELSQKNRRLYMALYKRHLLNTYFPKKVS